MRVVRSATVGGARRPGRAGLDPAATRGRAELHRTNFHGRTVTLAGGPALAAGATLGAVAGAPSVAVAAAAFTAGSGVGGGRFLSTTSSATGPEQKAIQGFPRPPVGAAPKGRVTSGLVKIAGVGAAGLVASALLAKRPLSAKDRGGKDRGKDRGGKDTVLDVLLGAGVIAGTANLLNLLDLRPGRALKAGGLIAGDPAGRRAVHGGVAMAGPLGAGAALAPADLGEEIMLGDSGRQRARRAAGRRSGGEDRDDVAGWSR